MASKPVESGGGTTCARKLIACETIVPSPDARPNLEAEQLEEIADMEADTTHDSTNRLGQFKSNSE